MNIDQIPLLGLIKGKMGYVNDRQRLIAQNVANADTPGYAPVDLKPFNIQQAQGPTTASSIGTMRTNTAHLAGKTTTKTKWRPEEKPDSEVRLDGNQVVLEEQMMKMTEARMEYDAAIGLYQKSLGLLRLAARRPS